MAIKRRLINVFTIIICLVIGKICYSQAPVVHLPTCIGTATGSTAYITVTNYPGSGTYSIAYSAPSPIDPNINRYSNFLQIGNCPIVSSSGTTCNIQITVSSTTGLPAMGNYVLTYTNAAGSSGTPFLPYTASLNMNSVAPPILTITGNGITNTVQSTSPSTPNTADGLIGYDCIPLSSAPSSTLVLTVTQPGSNTYSWSFGTSDGYISNSWTSTQAIGSTAPYTVTNSNTLTISNFNNQPGLIKLTVGDGCNNAVTYTYIINRFLPSTPAPGPIPNNLYPGLIQFDKTCTTAGVPITAYVANTQTNNPGSLGGKAQNLQANLNNFNIYSSSGWPAVSNGAGVVTITPPASTAPGTYTIAAVLNATVWNTACAVNLGGTILVYTINVLPVISITGNTSVSSGASTLLTASPTNCVGCTYNWTISSGGGSFYYPNTSTSNTAVYIGNGNPATIKATYNTGSCSTSGSIAVGPFAPPSAYASTGFVNYVRELVAKRPIVNESDILSSSMTSNDVLQTTSYYDGLYRPIESVVKQASPAGNDMVSTNTYDILGNETDKFLSFTSNAVNTNDITNDGNFKIDPFQQQVAFYNNQLTGQQGETNVGINNLNWAYSKINYETSPANRVTSSFAPGTNWVGSENTSTPHSNQQQYLVNTSIDNVQIWNIAATQGSIPISAGAYIAGELSKSISIDELGHQTIEYLDQYGQIILKKQQITATADNGTGSPHSGWLCTYYVYDDYGNLRFVITPKLVALIDGSWSISQSNADELCYRYEYDLLNRMIIKKNPGTPTGIMGEVWMVYDQRNRIVMQQDANMRNSQKWQYIQYDVLDRPIATGLMTDPSNYNNLNYHLTNAATSIAYPNISLYTTEGLSQTFYDNYAWMNITNSSSLTSSLDASTNGSANSNFTMTYNVAPTYAQPLTQSLMTRGMATGNKVEVVGSNGTQYIYSASFCDNKGRIIQTQSINLTGGKDIGTVCYNFIGKPLQTVLSHNKAGINSQAHIASSAMTYDVMGRLLTIAKTMNSTIGGTVVTTPAMTISTNQYDELGRLKIKTLGSNMESLTYDYNIRNWLLGINRNYVSGASTSNYFGMELGYDNPISIVAGANYTTPQYNGNISGTIWKSKGDGIDRKYDYTYDNVNRLISAPFTQQNGSSWDVTAGIDFSMQLGYNGNPAYDANGNISSMQQNGFKINSSPSIDQLTYSYLNNGNNTNRLQQVIDNANDKSSVLGDFKYDPATKNANVDYTYDANGNIISDNNRAISSIAYSYLNLPQSLTITNKGSIQYIYDAIGNKLQKITTENNATINSVTTNITTTTTYIGEFVYQSVSYSNPQLSISNSTDVLQFVGDEEGRIRFKPSIGTGSTALPASFVFDYFIRDNLNNTRMVLTDEQQQDIYPAATLEGPITNSSSMSYVENQYYTINPNDIVSTSPNTTPPSTLAWYSSAQNINYPNYNSLQSSQTTPVPVNNNPNLNTTQPSQYMYKLNGATGDKTGLGITLKVMAGDMVNIFGKSLYHINGTDPTLNNNNPIAGTLLSFLTNFTGTGAVSSSLSAHAASSNFPDLLNSTPNTNIPLTNVLNNVTTPASTPKAYINWILFDDQFKAGNNSSNFSPPNTTPDNVMNYDLTNMPTITVSKNGYLYIYCSNESNIDFYFDNLQVTQTRGRILEEAHYYPFGLTMAGISDKAWNKLSNKFHYQGNEMQNGEFSNGSGLEEYDFHARHYDQQLGVWHSPDPANQFTSPYVGMGNNWPNGVDPDGKLFFVDSWIAGFVSGGWNEANRRAGNDGRIWAGVFATDSHKTFFGQVWEGISRLTWQGPQQALGFTAAQLGNDFGTVNNVWYFHGATIVQGFGHSGRDFTLGGVIISDANISTNPSDPVLQHEYGHYLQSEGYGPLYFSYSAIPNFIHSERTGYGNDTGGTMLIGTIDNILGTDVSDDGNDWPYDPTEVDGNTRAYNYWQKYYPNVQFNVEQNPIGNIRTPTFGDWAGNILAGFNPTLSIYYADQTKNY